MDEYQVTLQAHNHLFIVLNPQGKKLAMKRLKRGERFNDIEEVRNDKEVKHLQKLKHQNIIQILNILYNSTERTGLIILPYYELNLLELIEKEKHLADYQIRHMVKQLFDTLSYTHSQNIFHRDLNPENIMVEKSKYSMDKDVYDIKLIDFGSSKSKTDNIYTDYVCARWYRAPELLLSCPVYSEKVDIFSVGCIIYEIYHKKPLFPGSSELAQLKELCVILGSPTAAEWGEGYSQAQKKGMELGNYKKSNLKMIFNDMPSDMVDLCSHCLTWNPEKRISAKDALSHPSLTNAI